MASGTSTGHCNPRKSAIPATGTLPANRASGGMTVKQKYRLEAGGVLAMILAAVPLLVMGWVSYATSMTAFA